jgi:hypothetical protein
MMIGLCIYIYLVVYKSFKFFNLIISDTQSYKYSFCLFFFIYISFYAVYIYYHSLILLLQCFLFVCFVVFFIYFFIKVHELWTCHQRWKFSSDEQFSSFFEYIISKWNVSSFIKTARKWRALPMGFLFFWISEHFHLCVICCYLFCYE